MKRIGWIALLLLALLLGAAIPTSAQDARVRQTTLSVTVPIDVANLEDTTERSDLPIPDTFPLPPLFPVEGCGGRSNHFTLDPDGRWFRFREDEGETGCGELRANLTIPSGATSFQVIFRADRHINERSALFSLPPRMHQEVRVYYNHNTTQTESHAYYPPSSESQVQFLRIDGARWELPSQANNLSVGWFFFDEGQELDAAGVPYYGQELVAVVMDPAVRFDGVPADAGIKRARVGAVADTMRYHTTVSVHLDQEPVPGVNVAEGTVGIRILTADSLTLDHVAAPDGRRVAKAQIQEVVVGGERSLVVPGEVVAAHGAGTYRVVYGSTQLLEPHPGMAPLVVGLVVTPAVLGGFAAREVRALRREAVGGFVRTARLVRTSLTGVTLIYIGVLAWVTLAGQWRLVTAWPIQVEAAAIHSALMTCSAAYMFIGFLWKRQLASTMQQELEEKRHTNAELDRSNQELAQFAYVASHDLQEPLRTVASYTQLLQRRYKGQLDEDADEFMQYAVDGANRMQRLIHDLLELSRVGTHGKPFTQTDLGEVVQQVKQVMHVRISELKAQLSFGDLPTVMADQTQIERLIQNLVSNALKFHNPKRAPRIRIEAVDAGSVWEIQVHDNGIGIEPDYHEKIFQVFQRLHSREAYPGTGIGLAVCKRIVERHGGRIWVSSTKGKGSTFHFTMLKLGDASI